MFFMRRTPLASILLPILLADAIVLALCGALYFGLAIPIKTSNLETEGRRLDLYRNIVQNDIDTTIGDIRLLATGDGINEYLASGSPADLQRAITRAVYVSKDNPDYDKVRYIDENGHEVFRVNTNGAVVPPVQLQDKSTRPFFQKANALVPDQVYISPIDLNVDNGAIQQPFNPTLRLAVPIFDPQGRHRGIYVINYRAANIFDELRRDVPRRATRLRILNQQGYWLVGASPETEWGFQVPSRAGSTLAKDDPQLWAQVQAAPVGQAPYQGGYFTWSCVAPGSFASRKPVHLVSDADYIILASVITPQEWAEPLQSLRQTFIAVALLLVALTTVTTRFFQSRRQAQLERDRFFNLSRDLLGIAGFDGCFTRVNPAWEAPSATPPGTSPASPFSTSSIPTTARKTAAEAASLAAGHETVNFENRYRCKDGTYRWLLWSARSVPEDRVIYASGRDTTEAPPDRGKSPPRRGTAPPHGRKPARLRRLHALARRQGGDLERRRRTHPRLRRRRCRRPALLPLLSRRQDRREISRARAQARRRERPLRGGRLAPAQGRLPLLGQRRSLAMRNSQGELVGFVKVTRDVTARKEAGERIDKLNQELKSRADLLETANKELESFSYSVSHDLRAPLRHIHGFVELLQKSPIFVGQETAQRQMGVIAKAAREMGMLIDDLLAFSRTGRAEMQFSPVNMRDLVDQCIRGLEHDIADRKIDWQIAPLANVEGDAGPCSASSGPISSATPSSTPAPATWPASRSARKSAATLNGAVQDVVYFIRDNGVGFDMRYASKLFGVFQRLHRADDFEGTGIGLANVQRIIHRHGGKVWAESQVDAGATFSFSLPLKSNQAAHVYVNGQN